MAAQPTEIAIVAARGKGPDTTSTTARVLAILRILMEAGGPLPASEIAQRTGLARPTAYRYLGLFQREGMAKVSKSGFQAGPELYRLAALLHRSSPIESLGRPVMRDLVRATGETSLIAVYRDFDQRIVWQMIERGSKALGYTLTIDRPTTPVWGASGRVILAYLGDAEVDQILARDKDEKSPTLGVSLPTPSRLKRELTGIRTRGYHTSLGQRVPNAFSIAAPVFRAGGAVVAALSLSIPEMRKTSSTESDLAPLVVEKAQELSEALGASQRQLRKV